MTRKNELVLTDIATANGHSFALLPRFELEGPEYLGSFDAFKPRQAVVYVICVHRDTSTGELEALVYDRAGGESRLHGQSSCGVGGHVNDLDAFACNGSDGFMLGDALEAAVVRELCEELIIDSHRNVRFIFRCESFQTDDRVGLDHLGFVFIADCSERLETRDAGMINARWVPLRAIEGEQDLELWSTTALTLPSVETVLNALAEGRDPEPGEGLGGFEL